MSRSRSPFALILLALALVFTSDLPVAAQDATPSGGDQVSSVSADWPMFRANPAHTGTGTGPGPEGVPEVVWRFETGGGQTSPAVADGVVYIVSDANYLWALDAATGEERWRAPAVAGVGSAPAVGDEFVVVASEDALHAFDTATGEQRWRFPAGEESGFYGWPSPTLADGVVYAVDSDVGTLYALDAATGEEQWRLEVGVRIAVTPAVADGVVYVATEPIFSGAEAVAAVHAIDAATGEELWRAESGNEADAFFSSPAVVDGVLYIGSQQMEGPGAMRALDAATGEELWRFEPLRDTAVFSSPAVGDGLVYFGSDALYAVDAASGEQRWRLGMGEVHSSPAVVDGIVYSGGEEGHLVAAAAATGEELWNVNIGGGAQFRQSAPAVVDGMVFIQGSDSNVYAIGDGGADSSETLSTSETTSFVALEPELLMEATVVADMLPANPAHLDVYLGDWPAGISYRYEEDSPGVGINCPISGQFAYTLAGAADNATPAAETTVNPGECAVLPTSTVREERNPGDEPLQLINMGIFPMDFFGESETAPEIDFRYLTDLAPPRWGTLPVGPVAIALQRASLEPGEAVAPYDGEGLGTLAAAWNAENHVSRRADGSLRNFGDTPLDVYLLTAQSASPAANAASAAPAMASPVAGAEEGPATFVWQTSGGSETFALPTDVAIDPAGNLWVADGGNNQFQIFGPDGAFIEAWGTAGSGDGEFDFVRANGDGFGAVAFDNEGNIFVVDSGNRRVQKFDGERNFVTAWGGFGTGDGQFVDPLYVTIGANDNVYITDDRRDDIQSFDNDGNYQATYAGHGNGPGQIVFTGGTAADAAGNIYIADYGNDRVQKFAPDGSFLAEWGSPGDGPGEFSELNNVTVDADGSVYVADSGNHRIQVFDSNGQFLTEWGSQGTDAGQFNFPIDVALDEEGNIYVVDIDNNRIQKFALLSPLGPE